MLEMTGDPAPAWDSGNSTIWEEYIDIAFVAANSLILLITSAVGITANVFVILAVYRQKSLQTSNNALVVNLAVIDFLRCVFDCPILLTVVITVYQKGQLDSLTCDTQMASFSFSCCIQLLTLVCISAERHQAIAQPFKTGQRKARITALILLTWILAILMAVFSLMFFSDSPVHVRCQGRQRETSSSYDNFGLYMLFPLWAACFGLIIGFYTRIFALVRSHNRKIFDKGTSSPPKKDTSEDKPKKEETTIVANGHGKSEQNQTLSIPAAQTHPEPDSSKKKTSASLQTSGKAPQGLSISPENKKEYKNTLEISDLESDQPDPAAVQSAVETTKEKHLKTEQSSLGATNVTKGDTATNVKNSTTKTQKVSSNFDTENQTKERLKTDKETSPSVLLIAQSENPESTSVLLIEPKRAKNSNEGETLAVAAVNQVSSLPPVSSNVPETEAVKQNMEVEGAVCMMPSKAGRERARKKKESKMAKRAGYIIITFLLFWLPLIATILMNFVHKSKNTQHLVLSETS
ncbi:5-hydroxytryptamine receptor-like [Acanthochromis polyacanthus]|uniref:5-hydroxytryptamine receptor-like n=1 Tax=Acanthochromis polyacanthus TaxID=80966 RepID=UPI002234B8A0|nr:5-hydroxytryptamine receptor-like [Acanthochromis polyacanthus]